MNGEHIVSGFNWGAELGQIRILQRAVHPGSTSESENDGQSQSKCLFP